MEPNISNNISNANNNNNNNSSNNSPPNKNVGTNNININNNNNMPSASGVVQANLENTNNNNNNNIPASNVGAANSTIPATNVAVVGNPIAPANSTVIPLYPGMVIKSRWKLVKKIGQGAFGEIFAGVDLEKQESVAIKLEQWDNKKAVLKLEVPVLKKLQGKSCVCQFIHCGHYEDYNFLVMELLGENLSELRRKRPNGRFSMETTAKLGIQMLRSIEAIHELGYLHRDIKPSNFAMGLAPHRNKDCVMIDFGLTRKYRLADGQIRPPREVAGFRGTARYASMNSHLSKELSRRDDLWSLFYVLIEFVTGHLPWRKLKDKEQIGMQKIHCNSPELVKNLPPVFLTFMTHLQQLEYHETPQYEMLASLLQQLDPSAASPYPVFDWEMDIVQVSNTASSTSVQPLAERSGCSDDDDDRRGQFSSDVVVGGGYQNLSADTAHISAYNSAHNHTPMTATRWSDARQRPSSTSRRNTAAREPASPNARMLDYDEGIQMSEINSQNGLVASKPGAAGGVEPSLYPLVMSDAPDSRHHHRSRSKSDGEEESKSCLGRCVVS